MPTDQTPASGDQISVSGSNPLARFDVIVVGASFTGLTMAYALSRSLGPGARILLIDKGPLVAATADHQAAPGPLHGPNAMAISAGGKQMLDALGIWPNLADRAQPVSDIEITDSSLDAAIRPKILSYENKLDDGLAASYIVESGDLHRALHIAVSEDPSITLRGGATSTAYSADETAGTIELASGECIAAALVIAADGRRSALRQMAGIKLVQWDHKQSGIVCTVAHELPHEGRAVQHFLPAGPFAILPLVGDDASGHRNRSCITWSEDAARAREIMALDFDAFRQEAQNRFGHKLGDITLEGAPASWPLSTQLARGFISRRLALIGDAAHGVHPIAGQGLNLALRDVAALTEVLSDGAGLGLDLGNHDALERYERWRRFDSTLSAAAFSGLNRLFSNDMILMRSIRDAGLGVVDRLPGLKRFFVTEAAGLTGQVPKLLKGELV